jgi:hypothetical protein
MGARQVPVLSLAIAAVVCGFILYSEYLRRQQDGVLRDIQGQVALLSSARVDSGRGQPSVTMSARRDRLENAFALDRPEDLPGELRQRMDDALDAALAEGSVVSAFECRSSMCRIETVHSDRRRYEEFVRTAFLGSPHTPLNRPTFSAPLHDKLSQVGTVEAVTFLARDGHALVGSPVGDP